MSETVHGTAVGCSRRRLRVAGAAVMALAALTSAAGAQQTEERFDGAPVEIVHGFTLLDGRGGEPLHQAAIALRGHTIVAVGTYAEISAQWAAETNAFSVDLGGGWVIPGLIDSHVHLATSPNRARAERELERLLYGGVTAVRDMAGDARALASLARDSRLGEIAAPDIHFSALMAGPDFFEDPRPRASTAGASAGEVPWMQAITPETDIAGAVALARGTYAQGIKIYANLDADLVNRITYEAHRQGVRVWAHSMVFPARPLEVVEAGVDVISHVYRLAWEGLSEAPETYHDEERPDYTRMTPDGLIFAELFAAMKERGTILDATLAMNAYRDAQLQERATTAGLAPEDLPPWDTDFARALVRRAHEMGVDIIAGTDFTADRTDPFPALHIELGELVEHGGLSPMDAILAATSVAARAVGVDTSTGTIEAGKEATFVLLAEDPLEDISNVGSVREVWKSGRRFLRDDYLTGQVTEERATPGMLDTKSPQELLRSWVALWRSYDLDMVDDLFLQDDRLTYLSSETEGVITGFDAVVEHHSGFGFVRGGTEPSAELWVEDAVVSDFGESVVITAIWLFGDRTDRGAAQRGPMTITALPTPDGYRIAHMHFANYEPGG